MTLTLQDALSQEGSMQNFSFIPEGVLTMKLSEIKDFFSGQKISRQLSRKESSALDRMVQERVNGGMPAFPKKDDDDTVPEAPGVW